MTFQETGERTFSYLIVLPMWLDTGGQSLPAAKLSFLGSGSGTWVPVEDRILAVPAAQISFGAKYQLER